VFPVRERKQVIDFSCAAKPDIPSMRGRDQRAEIGGMSTGGSLCPNCRRPVRDCVCPKGAPGAAKPAVVRVGRETQGRAGKGVTTISGLPLAAPDVEALAAKLKKRCGSGGTVREGVIEIQGDHRDVIVAELNKLGWQAKRSGG
jgi:translation initiation factor 1